MIIISATLDFGDQVTRDRVVTQSAPVQLATREQEPGCLSYCFAADPSVPERIQVYELWQDEASLAAHFKHANYEAMKNLLQAGGIVATENRMYQVARDEPVYDADGQPRERFFTEPVHHAGRPA